MTLIYLTTTVVLADVVGLPFQAALASGFCVALAVHFTLQRVFVWVHEAGFALPFHWQATRYLLFAGVQYGLTVASTSLLTPVLGLPTEVVYLATVVVIGVANFLMFRNRIFHPEQTGEEPACAPSELR